ncbi:MAG TPA: bifunctional tRNA (5-methylaminomethyl-2-thiouridine)(34)-methyltransferase MnmD/FAD-dependent 5-carboxymethylaminomethyl-2-thiouridine(34) oxidoreductase MnmC [Burkholderiaceae bacterium]|nr:bifunctional tRNA (5-methylaminomethyl-2-thiouridine)(34)-methyltransferase MnmD/FAD-dependent 5-carboxymethylaminomethyl-2-thiouridine(34) oxidoreductase MnmC [Burkholderiaceae bacterium]
MNSAPVVPGTLAFDDHGVPRSPLYGDIYHPRSGAPAQARHVFLGGNELPRRWQGRDRFVVLETGFGLGHNFLATWQAWRDDPQRCERLVFIAIEQHPLTLDDLRSVHRHSALPELADALQRAWPPLTHNLHRLGFDGDAVELLLAFGDVQVWLPELVAEVDAFYLDGFAPALNPRMWDERVCKALGRLATPGATLATWSAAHALRRHLTSAGFEVRLGAGQGGKRDITLARYAPGFTPRRTPARQGRGADADDRHALIVGAGLAGCAAACALARQGWRSTVLERRRAPASEASGNPAGLFHGIVNAQDGVHARFNRAAALAAHAAVSAALAHGVSGGTTGLLRLETTLDAVGMHALLQRLGLPPDYVQALDASAASARAGLALAHPAWFYPAGGWVDPAGLARWFLARAANRVELRADVHVHSLRRIDSGWALLDAAGRTIAQACTVVLANAADALRLLGAPDWPIESVRGQISIASATRLATPRLPVAGAGYLLPASAGRAMFGATAQRGDADDSVRAADHVFNLAQLARLTGRPTGLRVDELTGRTAWRCSATDRLPLIGAVPDDNAAASARLDQPRFVPRLPGLFMFSALGSRGITWSALGAQLLASVVTGAPAPVEASLLDAVDPARFVSRRARLASAG